MRPVVMIASERQFEAVEEFGFTQVQSCMLLWCKTGAGTVHANGMRYPFSPGAFLVLPWNHAIRYYPDAHAPFLVAGIHVIPDHAPDVPVQFHIAHHSNDPWTDHPTRRDSQPPVCAQVRYQVFPHATPLQLLADYIVACYQRGAPTEAMAYQFGTLLVGEITHAMPGMTPDAVTYAGVQRVMAYLQTHFASPLCLDELAEIAHCSPSTLIRLFRRQLKRTPFQYLLELRMAQAAYLLASTRIPVGDVGKLIGIHDPYYFSKLFKQQQCCTPTAYRQSISLIR